MARHGAGDKRPPEMPLPCKQSLVASIINVIPEHLSRLMKRMKTARFDAADQCVSSASRRGHG
jgi:hypothetical protein